MLDQDSAAYAWLRDHLRGASAGAIAARLAGWGAVASAFDHPLDADDFGRCEALLDAIPELRARLPEMSDVSAYWDVLAANWDAIRAANDKSARIKALLMPIRALDPSTFDIKGGVISFGSAPFTKEAYHAARKAAEKGRLPMKNTPADLAVAQDAYNVTAEELRAFIERYEQLEAEKKDITDQQKEVMAEAKGRGYDTKVLRKIIALRKREPDDVAEEQAVMDLYKAALGME